MSAPFARRAGTVTGLVAAAGVTMVAGVWPLAGVASAEDLGPGRSHEAPPMLAEPVVEEPVVEDPVAQEPVVEEPVAQEPLVEDPVVEEPVAAGPGRSAAAPANKPGRLQDAPGRDKEPQPVAQEPVAQEPVAQEPVVGPPAHAAPGKKEDKSTAPAAPVMGPKAPVTGTVAEPVPAPVVVGPKAPDQEPDRGVTATRKGPRAAAPVVAGPLAAPRAARPPKVGPVVPVVPVADAAPMGPQVPVRTAPVRPESRLASAGRRSERARVAAAEPVPLRPTGAEQIVLPAPPSRPEARPLTVELASAIPSVAAGTAEAVARTPQLPLGIAGVVVLFLLLQNRIDRRDPKIAAARVEEDAPLQFVPADQVHLRVVTAA